MGITIILLVIGVVFSIISLWFLGPSNWHDASFGEYLPYLLILGIIGLFLVVITVSKLLKIGPFRQQEYICEDD